MEQIAFTMRLKPGVEAEYRKRHDEIWPELANALTAAGIRDYSIFLDAETGTLFATLKLTPDNNRGDLVTLPVMRRWWDYMADLMFVDATNKPLEQPLQRVFYLA